MTNNLINKKYKITLDEMIFIKDKRNETKLGFTILFKFFQINKHFPDTKDDIPQNIVDYIGKQLNIDSIIFDKYDWNGRTITYHRKQIREFFGFKEFSIKNVSELKNWLINNIIPIHYEIEYIKKKLFDRFGELKIEPPSLNRVNRIINSALNTYENTLFDNTLNKLTSECIQKIDAFVISVQQNENNNDAIVLNDLKNNPKKPDLKNAFKEIDKLKAIKGINLPENLFDGISPKYLKKYYTRSVSENINELKRHPEPIKYTLLSIFIHFKGREIRDNLVDLLLKIIHNLSKNSERRIDKAFKDEIKHIRNKNGILLNIAKAVIENPDESIKDVIYPIIDQEKLVNLVKELEYTSKNHYNFKLHEGIKSSYQRYYRRVIPKLITALNFCSNNEQYKPVIQAVELIKKYAYSKAL